MANNTNTTGRRIPDANILIVDRWNSMTDSKRKQIMTIFESANNESLEFIRQLTKYRFIDRLSNSDLLPPSQRLRRTDDTIFGFEIPHDKHRLIREILGGTLICYLHDKSIDWICYIC